MIGFIDEHKDRYGIEPICGVLPIVPSTYYAHHAQRRDPQRRSQRAKRDATLTLEIERVWGANFKVYGAGHDPPGRGHGAAARCGQPALQGEASERLVGGGSDVCGKARLRVRGLRHRRLRTANRRLAGIPFAANGPLRWMRWSRRCTTAKWDHGAD